MAGFQSPTAPQPLNDSDGLAQAVRACREAVSSAAALLETVQSRQADGPVESLARQLDP